MKKDDNLYLIHISECIQKIEGYTKQGRDLFIESPMAQDAVLRNFEIIGEAAKKVSAELKKKNDKIPWKRITGLRDVLIHDYMGVDLEEVWNIIKNFLPDLKLQVGKILGQS